MTPVISPWAFYLIGIIDPINTVIVIASIGFFFLGLMARIIIEEEKDAEDEEEKGKYETVRKASKTVIKFAIALAMLAVLLPSGETVGKMIVAQNVTYERVEVAANTVQEVYEDIIGLFEEEK